MSVRAAGDVRREQRSAAAAARQRQRRPRHGEGGGGGGGGSGAGPAATAAAMAAVGERRSLPSPEAMLGQPWSHWVDAAKLHGNDGERPPSPSLPPCRLYRPGPRSLGAEGAPLPAPPREGPWGADTTRQGARHGGVLRPGRPLGLFPPPPLHNVAAEFVVRYAVAEAAAPPGRGLGCGAERAALAPVPVIRDMVRGGLSQSPEAGTSCPGFSLGSGPANSGFR